MVTMATTSDIEFCSKCCSYLRTSVTLRICKLLLPLEQWMLEYKVAEKIKPCISNFGENAPLFFFFFLFHFLVTDKLDLVVTTILCVNLQACPTCGTL